MQQPKKPTFLSSINLTDIDSAHKTTKEMVTALTTPVKIVKSIIVPASIVASGTASQQIYKDLNRALKMHAAKNNTDIRTLLNDLIYKEMVAKGEIIQEVAGSNFVPMPKKDTSD